MEATSFEGEEDNNPFSQSHQTMSSFVDGAIDESGHSNEKDQTSEDDSILLFHGSKNNRREGHDSFNTVQINYESRVTKLLRPKTNAAVQITEAGNSSEGMVNSSKKYVVYTIKLFNEDLQGDEVQTRRRYSDFESLRDTLTKIFPLIIIPPIPPKNYFSFTMLNLVGQGNSNGYNNGNGNLQSNYSYINSNHLNKNKLIEHRKRLLSNFLNNCLQIPQVRNLELFAKFLDPNANWSDETALVGGQLPKSIYLSNPENALKTPQIYENLPNPVSNQTMSFFKDNRNKLRKRTNKILSTDMGNHPIGKGADHELCDELDTSSLDHINKKIMENFSGLSNDYMELGAVCNSFSLVLSEVPRIGRSKSTSAEDDSTLNIIFDKIGQVFDRSYITINALIGNLETKFSEPLGEAVQYSNILEFIGKFRERKFRQSSLLENELEDRKKELQDLVSAEKESGRVQNVVENHAVSKNTEFDLSGVSENCDASSKQDDTSTGKFKLSSINPIKRVTQYVAEMIDQNPEQTRKQKINSLLGKVSVLEKCQAIMLQDINYVTDEFNKNVTSFHNKQLKVIYEILSCYNGFLMSWAKKNLDIWEDIKLEIEKL